MRQRGTCLSSCPRGHYGMRSPHISTCTSKYHEHTEERRNDVKLIWDETELNRSDFTEPTLRFTANLSGSVPSGYGLKYSQCILRTDLKSVSREYLLVSWQCRHSTLTKVNFHWPAGCKEDCASCFSENFCTHCHAGHFLFRGNCENSCPNGLTANTALRECTGETRCSTIVNREGCVYSMHVLLKGDLPWSYSIMWDVSLSQSAL